MPTYVFTCPVCNVGFDVSRPVGTTAPLPACPACGGTDVRRVFAFSAGGPGFRHHPL